MTTLMNEVNASLDGFLDNHEKLVTEYEKLLNKFALICEHFKDMPTGDVFKFTDDQLLTMSTKVDLIKEVIGDNDDKKYRGLKHVLRDIQIIASATPELNMSNYTVDQVSELNSAMVEIYTMVRNER